MATTPYNRVTRPTSWRRLAIASWSKPDNPTVLGSIEVDMTESLRLIERLRQEQSVRVTVTHLVVKALGNAIGRYPDGNGLVIGRHAYQRKDVDIFCQVASEDGRDLSGVKVTRVDRRSVVDIANDLNAKAARVKARQDKEVEQTKATLDRLPAWLLGPMVKAVRFLTYNLRLDLSRFGVAYDQFGSAMVSSIGSIDAGLGLVFAPLVPISHVPIVVLVCNVQPRPAAVGDRIEIRPVLTLGCSFDHRFFDGVLGARIAQALRAGLLEPQQLLCAD
jgi:pyruvate/2-oxoglutarate dehydrogenase complex dihydrolipoamide acyltransferase (E2) component